MTIQNFDLINNSRYLWNQIKKSGKFEDYPTEAYCIYSNFKRSGLTSTEFSEKTKIPKNIINLLGACKKPNGNNWSELLLLISEVNGRIKNDFSLLINLTQSAPIEHGLRKYSDELISKLIECDKGYKALNIIHWYPIYLNYIGFDLSQWEILKAQHKTATIVEKDVKRAKKVKEMKLIPSFKIDPVVLGTKEMVKGKGKPDKHLALRVVAEYRKLSALADSYRFKQFCEDIDAKEHYRSLNYYYHNFDNIMSKPYVLEATTKLKSEQYEVSVKDVSGETTSFVIAPKADQITKEDLDKKEKEIADLKRCLDEKDNLLKMYEEDNQKLKIQNDEKERYISYLTNQRDEVLNKLEVVRDFSNDFLKNFKK